ncbi:related to RAD2-structure-specific nuclease of the nucleotide excision repairosome [Serendipita indica DSM 11827]|uniref:Related to RAD2-structure-specific nuclease of the nucleotide excision repairosome n=1 Tax=Serendipita indica (strain DSM 11827) TaxID=1109443 RepID=G4THI1_SERID|nr:related to RAD2-structure-specific nuclease of the nucleotide excision repairosome [Serendipita indica DSM 11827]
MGVKQLWKLLSPVGRPVLLETMEGKALAIDSSIWIYQFQATMRDKEGRGLVNAHLLGFLRRICKLLFYGIKPVFVFDGGAPALKRSTIVERKRRKAGAAISHAKVAERLLAAQLRREAIGHVKKRQPIASTSNNGPVSSSTGILNEDTVYMEDLLPPVAPSPKKIKSLETNSETSGPPASPKKYEWRDHDPYKLPAVDMAAKIADATRVINEDGGLNRVDPRLATEDELRQFIETMRPEDFDATSPAFRELPTEVQYEIIGDLRLKSRQTSHTRLQKMLQNSRTAMDFSKAQIRGLHDRNRLTQQLLMTTNSMGKEIDHHIMIQVRVAAERNREYVLIKNTGPEGGWSLGIQDQGTKEKPIQVQPDSDDEEDMEEVPINEPALHYPVAFDQRRMALASIGKSNVSPSTTRIYSRHSTQESRPNPQQEQKPLFAPSEEGDSDHLDDSDSGLDEAIRESWKEQEERDLQQALVASRRMIEMDEKQSTGAGSSRVIISQERLDSSDTREDFESPIVPEDIFGSNELVTPRPTEVDTAIRNLEAEATLEPELSSSLEVRSAFDVSDFFGEPEGPSGSLTIPKPIQPPISTHSATSVAPPVIRPTVLKTEIHQTVYTHTSLVQPPAPMDIEEDDDDDMVEEDLGFERIRNSHKPAVASPKTRRGSERENPATSERGHEEEMDEEPYIGWSRSPSPANRQDRFNMPSVVNGGEVDEPATKNEDDDWDAAQEMNPAEEEGDFAQFLSQVKGRDLDTVREEIDQEIKQLNQARKVLQRDSEEITQQMVSQIMMLLRLFGIPYITAPMEAEAQCAKLLSLGLVEGVITDDSDVFLFGATRVFKNMFNQSKTVECFLAADLQRELGLDQEKLIRLAYLLGSDYVDGLEGVGPVVAMEILNEFETAGKQEDSLLRFKEWWRRVQSGQDTENDTGTEFRKRFKKKFKNLHLAGDWPNPAVRDAYLHPTVDESEEAFKWGLPDLDALRTFLHEELHWVQAKTDELLLPIIRKMGERGRNPVTGRQGTLTGYFDQSGGFGSGTLAPRKRQQFASKRLQQVVSDYRKKQDRSVSTSDSEVALHKQNLANPPKPRGGKRMKSDATIGRPQKRRRTIRAEDHEDVATESGGDDGHMDKGVSAPIPDRPLAVTLRTRKGKARILEDSDASS